MVNSADSVSMGWDWGTGVMRLSGLLALLLWVGSSSWSSVVRTADSASVGRDYSTGTVPTSNPIMHEP